MDGDGIAYRTLPGTDHKLAAYFTRGTGHDPQAVYSERSEDWVENIARLKRKFDTARDLVPAPEVDQVKGAEIGIISFGTSDACVVEGRDLLEDRDVHTSYLRVRALPLNDVTRRFIEDHDRIYVVENNSDGQLAMILHMEYPDLASRIRSLAYADGMPLTARWLVNSLLEQE